MPENHQRIFALPASLSRVRVRREYPFLSCQHSTEIRDALHTRTQEKECESERERERERAQFGDFAPIRQ